MLHHLCIIAVDNDLVASGTTFDDDERAQAQSDLVQYASLVEEVGCWASA